MTDETTTKQETQARTLGLARWVQVAFMVAFVLLFWILDKLVILTWEIFAEPNTNISTAGSALLAAGLVYWLYRNERINRLTHEIVGELSKVTWPSRPETTTSTVVVVITSIIAALILGAFDAVWSTITDLIYKV